MASTHELTLDPRYCGPRRSGNGGYVCGRIARHLQCTPRVRLSAPPPLQQAMRLEVSSDQHAELFADDQLIASAQPTTLELQVPKPCSLAEARDAAQRFTGHQQHSFPHCFVCGPKRPEGDGLRIFPGAVSGRELVAAPWTPSQDLADSNGLINAPFIWAALDCPSGFAVWPEDPKQTLVLGEFSVQIQQRPAAGETCRIIGWPIAESGRKRRAGSALFDAQDQLLAWAEATWICLPVSAFPDD